MFWKIAEKFWRSAKHALGKIRTWKLKRHCVFQESTRFGRWFTVGNDSGRNDSIRLGGKTWLHCELSVCGGNGEIIVGDNCFVGPNSRIWSWKKISIGNRVLISHSVTIFDSITHSMNARERALHYEQYLEGGHPSDVDLDAKEVIIHDDAWIGCGSIVMRGTVIGKGAVVGAGSVVVKDVLPWTVVAGVPAKFIRQLEPEERIEAPK